jgi:energy-coupling factor transport system substrate-specific component
MTAVPIYLFVFGGATGHFADIMTTVFLSMGQQLVVAVFSANILSSLADKIISGFVALAIVEALPPNLTSGVELPKATGLMRIVWIVAGLVLGIAVALISFFATQ